MFKKKKRTGSGRNSILESVPSASATRAPVAQHDSSSRESVARGRKRRPLPKARDRDRDNERPTTSTGPPKDQKVDEVLAEKNREAGEVAGNESSDSAGSKEVFLAVEKFPTMSGIALNKPNVREPKPRNSLDSEMDENQTRRPGKKCLDFYTLCFVSLIFLSGHLVTLPQ